MRILRLRGESQLQLNRIYDWTQISSESIGDAMAIFIGIFPLKLQGNWVLKSLAKV